MLSLGPDNADNSGSKYLVEQNLPVCACVRACEAMFSFQDIVACQFVVLVGCISACSLALYQSGVHPAQLWIVIHRNGILREFHWVTGLEKGMQFSMNGYRNKEYV